MLYVSLNNAFMLIATVKSNIFEKNLIKAYRQKSLSFHTIILFQNRPSDK